MSPPVIASSSPASVQTASWHTAAAPPSLCLPLSLLPPSPSRSRYQQTSPWFDHVFSPALVRLIALMETDFETFYAPPPLPPCLRSTHLCQGSHSCDLQRVQWDRENGNQTMLGQVWSPFQVTWIGTGMLPEWTVNRVSVALPC